jgi:glycine C-acetyltransferase
MSTKLLKRLESALVDSEKAGTYKHLKSVRSAIGAQVQVEGFGEVGLFCSNDYLGFANHPAIIQAAKAALDKYGASTASVRFICGTQAIHQQLEEKLAFLHGTEAALTYSSCWSANTGLFSAICSEGDVILSDELNHASLIDGIRVAGKEVRKKVYRHSDMGDLEARLIEYQQAPARIIVTDGVFSMEGDIALLDKITNLAEKYDALVVLDDSHGLGVVGPTGQGVAEHFGVSDKIDIFTGTLGKALAAGTGGFVAGPKAVTETLIQKSRPHLFSNALPPSVAAAGIAAIDLLIAEPERVTQLQEKASWFRNYLTEQGLTPLPGDSAIVPVILGETATAIRVAEVLLKKGVFVTGFGFPVVPEGEARVRFQVSVLHETAQLKNAVTALKKVLS